MRLGKAQHYLRHGYKEKNFKCSNKNETVVIHHAPYQFINLAKNKMLNRECGVG
jgi:hypothetical protein